MQTGLVTSLQHHSCENTDHQPYTPNIMSIHLHNSGIKTLKKHTAGKQFAANVITKQAVTSWLQTLVTDLFHGGV